MSADTFPCLISAHRQELMPYAAQLTRNGDNADDLYQETMVRALQYSEKFRPGTNLRAWLFTIMRNTFINDYRRRKRHPLLAPEQVDSGAAPGQALSVENKGPGNLDGRELDAAVDALPPLYRVAFELFYRGYRYAAIATLLGLPLGTVKSRIHAARQLLIKAVDGRA